MSESGVIWSVSSPACPFMTFWFGLARLRISSRLGPQQSLGSAARNEPMGVYRNPYTLSHACPRGRYPHLGIRPESDRPTPTDVSYQHIVHGSVGPTPPVSFRKRLNARWSAAKVLGLHTEKSTGLKSRILILI